ncbi:MAG: elongator complex protein 3 [Eubacteriales bacterium]
MKTHTIIPIFIPHEGCPNDCVFCNQKKITAKTSPVLPHEIKNTIDTYLSTIDKNKVKTVELAFFGGSFTGLSQNIQNEYLKEALKYKKLDKIDKIHLSTRPDYINEQILDNLKKFEVSVIELGVQSFDPDVLKASKRGHTVDDIYKACALIREYGFTLGIQLMIGLPADSKEKCIESAKKTAQIKPEIARLYPTVILDDTELFFMYKTGKYFPLSESEAVEITKEIYKILVSADINIIRVGLKSSDLINKNTGISDYHPAFRQLVEGEIAKEELENQLLIALSKDSCKKFHFESNSFSFSNMLGNKSVNKRYFSETYPDISIRYSLNNALANYTYNVIKYKGI